MFFVLFIIDYPVPTISAPNPKNDFECAKLDDGTWKMTGYEGTSKSMNMPSKIDGIAVTSIGDFAFFANALTSVIIPNSVTDLNSDAFDQSVKITRTP